MPRQRYNLLIGSNFSGVHWAIKGSLSLSTVRQLFEGIHLALAPGWRAYFLNTCFHSALAHQVLLSLFAVEHVVSPSIRLRVLIIQTLELFSFFAYNTNRLQVPPESEMEGWLVESRRWELPRLGSRSSVQLAEWQIFSMWRSLPVAVEVIGHRLRDRHTSRMGRANEFHSNLALLH